MSPSSEYRSISKPQLARRKERKTWRRARFLMMIGARSGTCFNYAYRLYGTPEWRERFGPFRRPYRRATARPFSKSCEATRAGYAQKHPARTRRSFAVWLKPGSSGAPVSGLKALAKGSTGRRRAVRDVEPLRLMRKTDVTVEEMARRWRILPPGAGSRLGEERRAADLGTSARPRRDGRKGSSAADLLRENRQALIDKVTYWTGVHRSLVRGLVDAIVGEVAELDLRADVKGEREHLTEITVYATALAMNYLTRGKFVQS